MKKPKSVFSSAIEKIEKPKLSSIKSTFQPKMISGNKPGKFSATLQKQIKPGKSVGIAIPISKNTAQKAIKLAKVSSGIKPTKSPLITAGKEKKLTFKSPKFK